MSELNLAQFVFETQYSHVIIRCSVMMPANIYINGYTIGNVVYIPDGSVSGFTQRFELYLLGPINDIVISPSTINDPNAGSLRILYIPGAGAINLNYQFMGFPTFIGFTNISASDDGTGQSIKIPPDFSSYFEMSSSFNPPYVDAYGRVIKDNTPKGVNTGKFIDSINLDQGISYFYGKVQGYWQNSSLPTGIEFDEQGYFHCSPSMAPGTYKLFPITTKGHVDLSIIVPTPQASVFPDEILFYTFSGRSVNASSYTTATTGPMVSGIITTNSSIKFKAGNFIFNIIVLQVPSIKKIRVAQGFEYFAHKLLSENLYASADDFSIFSSSSLITWPDTLPQQPSLPSVFGGILLTTPSVWSFTSVTGAIYLFGQLVAVIEPILLPVTTTTIFARVKRSFNIFDHIQPSHPGDFVKSVDLNPTNYDYTFKPDGYMKFNSNKGIPVRIDCTLSLLGVEIVFNGSTPQNTLNLLLISDNAYRHYLSSDFSLNLKVNVGETFVLSRPNENITINTDLSAVYKSQELQATGHSDSVDIEVYTECLILIRTSNDGGLTYVNEELHLLPFQDISSTKVLAFKDDTGSVSFFLPYGPTYKIGTDYTGRGGNVSFVPSSNDLLITSDNYNSGISIPLKVVSGITKKVQLVNQTKIENSTAYSILPPFVSVLSNDLVVKRIPGEDYSSSIVAQDNSVSNGAYTKYTFEILEPVKLNQIIYYEDGNKYNEVVPLSNYLYDSTMTNHLSNNDAILSPDLTLYSFKYAELSGTMKMMKFNGGAKEVLMYLETDIIGPVEIHHGSKSGQVLSLPYTFGGYTINGISGGIRITKVSSNVNVDQFIGVVGGVATLYTFRNLPEYVHQDVFVYSGNQWTTDVALTVPQYQSVSKGAIFDFSATITPQNEVFATVDFTAPSMPPELQAYGNYNYTFRIIKEAGSLQILDIVNSKIFDAGSSITKYSISPPNMIAHIGESRVRTSNCEITIGVRNVSIRAIQSNGESEIYIITSTKSWILKLVTHALPYAQSQIVEYYDDSFPVALAPPANVTFPSQVLINVGSNTVSYNYYSEGPYSTTITAKSIPKPKAFDSDRTIRLNQRLSVNLLNELFGTTTNYRIISAAPSPSTGLGVVISQSGQLVLTGGTSGKYIVAISIDAATESSLPNVVLNCNMTVIVWNPATSITKVFLSAPNVTTTVSTTSINGVFSKIEYNGQVLEGTSHSSIDWSNFDGGTVSIFSTTQKADNYFLYTSEEVIFLTVIVIAPLTPVKILYIPFGSSNATFNLLDVFYPSLEDTLIDAGINNVTNYTNQVISPTNSSSLNLVLNSVQLSTMQYSCVVVTKPTLINPSPSFVVPVKTGFELKSTAVSNDSELTIDNTVAFPPNSSGRNITGGISVSFTDVGDYSISCVLTNQGVSTLTISIEFIVYDPSEVKRVTSTVYTQAPQIYSFGGGNNIESYSIANVNYGLSLTNFVTNISNQFITVSTDQSFLVVTAKLSSGLMGILEITYVKPEATSSKIYLLNSEAQTLSSAQVSNISAGTITFDTNGYAFEANGYAVISSAGVKVGWVKTNAGNVTFQGNEPGVWDNLGLDITISSGPTVRVFPYIETLKAIVIVPSDLIVEKGTSVNLDVNNYVVSGISNISFTSWSVNGSSPPPWITFSNSLIRTSNLNTAGTYLISGIAKDVRKPSLVSVITFNIVVVDTALAITQQVILIDQFESTLILPGIALSVNKEKLTSTQLLIDNVKLVFDGTNLTLKASTNSINPFTLDIITNDATRSYVSISQVGLEKDINVIPMNYSGSLFKNSISMVTSYTVGDLPGTYSPDVLYTLPGGGTIVIKANGDFVITNSTEFIITVSYTSSSSPQTLKLTIGGNADSTVYINQFPASTLSLGKNVVRATLAGEQAFDGSSVNLGYAKFLFQGDSVIISDVTSDFQPTLIQAENSLTNQIKVISMLVDINRNTGVQTIYSIPFKVKVRFVLPYTPLKIVYDTMNFEGSNAQFALFDDQKKFANVTISGLAFDVETLATAGLSQPIGFMNSKGGFVYAIVDVNSLNSNEIKVKLGDVVLPPDGDVFKVVGLLDGSEIANNGEILSGLVKNKETNLQILSTNITDSLTFYASTKNGKLITYKVPFITKEILVSDVKQIPIIAFLGATPGALVFRDSTITVNSFYVLNPQGLQSIYINSPFYGRFLINKL